MTGQSWFLSKARIREDASVASLRKLLVPQQADARADASHRLIWSLFGDHPDRERDFLWRESKPGSFYVLARRPPVDAAGIFEISPPKLFAPELAVGDRLQFALRANATRTVFTRGQRGARHDVVMHALQGMPKTERAEARPAAIQREGRAWLEAQGERTGFTLAGDGDGALRILSYQVLRVGRSEGPSASLGILDMEGVIRVDNPAVFCDGLVRGFGRGKAFGCGLMLVRRC